MKWSYGVPPQAQAFPLIAANAESSVDPQLYHDKVSLS